MAGLPELRLNYNIFCHSIAADSIPLPTTLVGIDTLANYIHQQALLIR